MEYKLRPLVSWSFCKTTIIRQLRKWNESKIEKIQKNTDKKPLGFRMKAYVWS